MSKRYQKTDKVTKPHVLLEDNRLVVRLPPDMYYIADALEIMLPAVLHKFAVHRKKGDWITNQVSIEDAVAHLRAEIKELEEAIAAGSPEEVVDESADVMNQALIIGTLFKHLTKPQRQEFEFFGRKFVARSDGEVEYSNGLKAGQLVKFRENAKGYLEINMYGVNAPGGYRLMSKSRAILTAFKGPPPSEEHHCDHRNGLLWDNRPSNLRWLHQSENSAQSGRQNHGIPHQMRSR